MRAIAVIYVAIAGWLTHGVVTNLPEQQVAPVVTVATTTTTIYDPRPHLPAPTTTTVPVTAMSVRYEDRCPEWRDAVLAAGVTLEELPTAMRIIYRESRCNAGSVNSTLNRDGSIDYGLSQVNDRTWCLPTKYSKRGWLQQQGILTTCADLLDPATNIRAMVALMRYSEERTGCPWTPWRLCD